MNCKFCQNNLDVLGDPNDTFIIYSCAVCRAYFSYNPEDQSYYSTYLTIKNRGVVKLDYFNGYTNITNIEVNGGITKRTVIHLDHLYDINPDGAQAFVDRILKMKVFL